jgi:hypothetical protein
MEAYAENNMISGIEHYLESSLNFFAILEMSKIWWEPILTLIWRKLTKSFINGKNIMDHECQQYNEFNSI